MTRVIAERTGMVVAVAVAAAGLLIAGRLGDSTGTPAPPKASPSYSCPATAPDACVAMVAEHFGIAAGEVPTIGAIPAGLHYERGWIVKAPNGREVAVFDFRDPTTGYVYNIGFVRMAPPTRDASKVAVTPSGRKYRAVENEPLGLRYVISEPRVAVVVQVIGAPTRGTSVRRTAEELLDAVHLSHQVDPRP